MAKMVRVGLGYDVHRLGPGRALVLCGVEIPFELGLLGHSDADVALHALIDALLGAAGLGDIGEHFPDTEEAYKDIASTRLLDLALQKIEACGWEVGNVDLTIVAQRPKLAPYKAAMRKKLASLLGVSEDAVNIKAKTTEGLGFCGRGEGIAAYAVALIQK